MYNHPVLINTQPPARSGTATPRDWIGRGFYFSLGAALLLVLAIAVRDFGFAVASIVAPFAVGAAIAMLIDPIIRRVQSRHIGRPMAVFLVFGMFLVIAVGGSYLTIPKIVSQASELASQGTASIDSVRTSVNDFLKEHRKIGRFKIPKTLNFDAIVTKATDYATATIEQSTGNIADFLVGYASLVVQTIVAILVTFYILLDYDRMRGRFFFLIPDRYRPQVRMYTADIGGVFAQYVRALILECLLYGLCMVVLLEFLSIWYPRARESAMVVGALAAVLYSVPYIGAITIFLLTFIVAYSAGGAVFGAIAGGLAFLINQSFDYVVTPRLIGGRVGLHPVAALFALALGAELFKLWGLILSVPLAGSVQVILYRLYPKLCEPTPSDFLTPDPYLQRGQAVTEVEEQDG